MFLPFSPVALAIGTAAFIAGAGLGSWLLRTTLLLGQHWRVGDKGPPFPGCCVVIIARQQGPREPAAPARASSFARTPRRRQERACDNAARESSQKSSSIKAKNALILARPRLNTSDGVWRAFQVSTRNVAIAPARFTASCADNALAFLRLASIRLMLRRLCNPS